MGKERSDRSENNTFCVLDTPVGPLKINLIGEKIASVERIDEAPLRARDSVLKQLEGEFARYFDGEEIDFSAEPFLTGTAFQKAVYDATRTIPYGEVRSYSDIARAIGKPGASRAVGQALNKNRHLILVPCHRVVPKSGGIGGFKVGQEIKKYLLHLEREGHSE